MDKTLTLCKGCIIMAICTKMCEETENIMIQSLEKTYILLKMKCGTSLMKRVYMKNIDFLKKVEPSRRIMSNKMEVYIGAINYAIKNKYIATNDPGITKLNQYKQNLIRCKLIRDRIIKNDSLKKGGGI
jgi:hypothetical protein